MVQGRLIFFIDAVFEFREDKRMKTLSIFLSLTLLLSTTLVHAQARRVRKSVDNEKPTFTYDIGASSGTYNGVSYSEINLGLNWHLNEYLVWRNSGFHRFGTRITSASGLDTSARFVFNTDGSESGLGLGIFAGPGYRISNKENSGVFGEAGVTVKAGGLNVGVGVKSISYNSPGENSDGTSRTKTDTTVFIILAGGGAF